MEGYGYDSRHMALADDNGVSLAAGPMVATGRELDFAVKGNGLIVLQDGDGEAYTRQGSMQVDAEGRLTLNGRAVLGEGGPIVLPEYDRMEIGNDGTVSIMAPGDFLMAEVDRIRLVDVPAANLMKNPAGLLVTRDGEPAQPSEEVRLVSGFLESSNVSAIDELASTMSLNRLFETQVKMMKAAEDLSDAGNRMIRGS
ncbi:flagellar basal-body rod protein FlgF [Pseudomonas sp. BAY1663]|nr:flagellar basal-body rod protein FlgF [Pseudomonas sp. BAY1663]